MKLTSQNLNDRKQYWSHGRAWIRPAGEWWEKLAITVEWTLPCGHCGWGITFGDSGRNLRLTLTVPFLLTLYVTFEHLFKGRLFEYDFDRGDDREIAVSFHSGRVWWRVWVGTMASWSRDYPWCRWWRQGNFNFASLLGKQAFSCETLDDNIPVEIEMPEGTYRGLAKIERRRWKRPLWFEQMQISTWINVAEGIPFSGKGENSWDCGDDGLHGAGVEGVDVAAAIRHFREVVLKNRNRYGQPSERAIEEALGAVVS